MQKQVFTLTLDYVYDSNRKGAKYSLDGGLTWGNGGEFKEAALKHCIGVPALKDANTPFDKGSDIPELKASVKSSRFTLTTEVLADTFEKSKEVFFRRVHSNKFIYVVIIENELTAYTMNKREFSEFLDNWASLNERGVIRAKSTSTKMINWFEERVAQALSKGLTALFRYAIIQKRKKEEVRMSKMLVFDMDGTIADLYGVENWLTYLRAENPLPYVTAEPMYDMLDLMETLHRLKENGWRIAITSWLAKGASKDYNNRVRIAKKEWLDRFAFPYDELHFVKYGTTKANCTRNKADFQILVDDNMQVRKGWTLGATINAEHNILSTLKALV